MKTSDFHYDLPPELIAQEPLPERSASRLLHLNSSSGAFLDRRFVDLADSLTPGDLLVFNDTRVLPARLFGTKETGGRVEILVERLAEDPAEFVAMVRASKSPKPGTVIQLAAGLRCRVAAREDDRFRLRVEGDVPSGEVLERIGQVPLPPYIERSASAADRVRYQTVFAKNPGAVAAPTASLHFDDPLLARLAEKGIRTAYVTLHVGSGTFAPVRHDDLDSHVMHAEVCEVSPATVAAVEAARVAGRRVVAVGTTVVRTLESAAQEGALQPFRGETRLFIRPGFEFRCVDALLTNFHQPQSTLLALVSAFAGHRRILRAYRHAIAARYRFFSYGDAMWIDGRFRDDDDV